MPRTPRFGDGQIWRFEAMDRTGKLDRQLLEEQGVTPCCPRGLAQRVAERERVAPYRWIPMGFRCSVCGQLWLTMRTIRRARQ